MSGKGSLQSRHHKREARQSEEEEICSTKDGCCPALDPKQLVSSKTRNRHYCYCADACAQQRLTELPGRPVIYHSKDLGKTTWHLALFTASVT